MERGQNWKADADVCLRRGDSCAAAEVIGKILKKETQWKGRELAFAGRLIDIYEKERRMGEEHTVLDNVENLDEAVNRFVWVKLLFRRLEFGLPEEYWQELYLYCKEWKVSLTMLSSILQINIIQKEKTCKRLIVLYEKNEGKQSRQVRYLERFLQELDEVETYDDK